MLADAFFMPLNFSVPTGFATVYAPGDPQVLAFSSVYTDIRFFGFFYALL